MAKKAPKSIRLVEIESFIHAAELRSMTKAGAEQGISKSSVSRNITALGGWLGTLLTTDDDPFELTPAGTAFLPVARQVAELLNEARARHGTASAPKPVSAREIEI